MNIFKTKSDQQIVAEIHNEFDTAQDRLLMAADSLLAELNIPTEKQIVEKSERLKRLGFVKAEPVRIAEGTEKRKMKLVETREQAELIRYYKQNYPLNKFLTIGELDRICRKYNLVYMPVGNYIGDVPLKNIEEIEKAQPLRDSDKPEYRIWCKLKKDNSFFIIKANGVHWCGIWGSEWWRIPSVVNGVNFRNQYDASEWLQKNMGFRAQYLVRSVVNYKENRQGFFICAPASHFEGKSTAISFFKPEPKDPIVFRYVRGGVIVDSKWGLESNDEALVNEKMN